MDVISRDNSCAVLDKSFHAVGQKFPFNYMTFLHSCFRRSEEIDVSVAGDRAILYHRRAQRAIVLNPTGTLLWELLVSPQTFEELTQPLQLHFPQIEASLLHRDIEKYLHELVEQEAILAAPQ